MLTDYSENRLYSPPSLLHRAGHLCTLQSHCRPSLLWFDTQSTFFSVYLSSTTSSKSSRHVLSFWQSESESLASHLALNDNYSDGGDFGTETVTCKPECDSNPYRKLQTQIPNKFEAKIIVELAKFKNASRIFLRSMKSDNFKAKTYFSRPKSAWL